MTDLFAWTAILVFADVLYLIYERHELNPKNALNYEVEDEMIEARRRIRMFFIGLNIFCAGFWVKGFKEEAGLFLIFIGSVIAFLGRPC